MKRLARPAGAITVRGPQRVWLDPVSPRHTTMITFPVRLFSRRLVARLFVFAALATSGAVFGQSGGIQGRGLNVASGNYLNKARVTIPGTRLEAATDENGEFQLGNVPAGIVTVSVTYTGLPSQTKSVEVMA